MFTFWFILSVAMCGPLVLESQAKSVKWGPINWGPMKVWGHIGKLSHKYWPQTHRDKEASHNARYYADEFHRFIKTGLGEIPPLDPYFKNYISPLKIHDHEVRGTVQLSNLLIVGAKDYKVESVQVRLNTSRLDFVLSVPLLKSDFNLQANYKVDEAHNSDQAHVNASIHRLLIKGAATFKSWPAGADLNHQHLSIVAVKYRLKSPEVQYNARDVAKNTRRSGHSSSHVVKKIAQQIARKQAYASALSIIKLFNKILKHYTTAQILALLLPEKY